jgi:hypothetical protein
VTGETGVWGFSALTVGLNAEFYRASTPGLPYQVAMQRGVRMYHDQTTRPLHDLRWELLTLLAHGAFVTVVDKTGFDGWLDPVAYDRLGTAFRDAQARRAHFGHAPVTEVGIYFSSRTRDWLGREEPSLYFMSVQGAHKAMVYAHLPWAIVLDENATANRLGNLPVLLVPNAAIISQAERALFRSYVEQGGHLILTGWPGLLDQYGAPLPDSSMADLVGAKLVRRLESHDNWARLPHTTAHSPAPAALSRNIRPDWPFLVKGPAAVFEPTTARAAGQLLEPYRTTRQREGREGTEWPMSADRPVGPAVLLNRIGKGTVLTFACSPDYAAASEHHVVEARRLLANAVHALSPNPRVGIAAPTTVQAVVTDEASARRLRVHLLAYNAPPQTTPAKARPYVLPALIEDRPIFEATLEFAQSVKGVTAFAPSTDVRQTGQVVEVLVRDVHEVVTVQY